MRSRGEIVGGSPRGTPKLGTGQRKRLWKRRQLRQKSNLISVVGWNPREAALASRRERAYVVRTNEFD